MSSLNLKGVEYLIIFAYWDPTKYTFLDNWIRSLFSSNKAYLICQSHQKLAWHEFIYFFLTLTVISNATIKSCTQLSGNWGAIVAVKVSIFWINAYELLLIKLHVFETFFMDGHKFRVAFVYTQLLSSALVRVKLSFIDEDGPIVVETPLDEVKVQLAYRRVQDGFSLTVPRGEGHSDIKAHLIVENAVLLKVVLPRSLNDMHLLIWIDKFEFSEGVDCQKAE